tara:strand:- start:367 stop:993 length:627 start_codon:yes stop_codon:yes gene_type:complete
MFNNFNNTPTTTSAYGCAYVEDGSPGPAYGNISSKYVTSGGVYTSTTRCWMCDSGSTPSGSTGPNGGVVDTTMATSGTANSSSSYRYLYCETSSPNTTSTTFGYLLKTNNVPASKTVKVEFWYHMYGSNMGTMVIGFGEKTGTTSYSQKGSVTLSGQQQASQGAAWLKSSNTYSHGGTTRQNYVSLYYISGGGFRGDACFDSVEVSYT